MMKAFLFYGCLLLLLYIKFNFLFLKILTHFRNNFIINKVTISINMDWCLPMTVPSCTPVPILLY